MLKALPNPPKESVRRNVFIINDIDLIVPPSQIEVSQEDLLYNWRTLRSRASTKIATGHGQIRVHVTIQFTESMLLDLHRLIVQFRHSPFCSIQNDFLRETIAPDWPFFQQMAFTMTSMQVFPVEGLSDTWNLELDLLWFNYQPYVPNFLYREDWNTNWIPLDKPLAEGDHVKLSIGWELDPITYKRNKRLSTLAVLKKDNLPERTGLTWSAITDEFLLENDKSLYALESTFLGESFDLLPLPDNMEPANFVFDPRNSRIYVRYINYLQRDAMIKHFGFNPEEDLGDLSHAFFGVVETETGLRTYGLHNGPVPRHIRNKWLSAMLKYNSSVTFSFHLYKEVRLPQKWSQLTNQQKMNFVNNSLPNRKQGTKFELQPTTHNGTPLGEAVEVRAGFWEPVGKCTPCGTSAASSGPASIEEILKRVTSRVTLRDSKKDQQLYKNDSRRAFATKGSRLHKGTDIGIPVGTPLYAIADGTVITTLNGQAGYGVRWEWIEIGEHGIRRRGRVKGSPYLDDWEKSITAYGTNNLKVTGYDDYFGPRLDIREFQAVGTFIKSISSNNPNIWYIASYTDGGQQISIRHDDGSISKYMHVDEIHVVPGQRVRTGEQIGTSGDTSSFRDAFLEDLFATASQNPDQFGFVTDENLDLLRLTPESLAFPDDRIPKWDSPYTLRPHLHFEYHESANISAPRTNEQPNKFASISKSAKRVLVDPVPSWEAAINKKSSYIERVAFDPQVAEVTEDIDLEVISDEEIAEIRELLSKLNADGWIYYDKDVGLTNVWYKPVQFTIANSNGPGPAHTNQTAVFANASGGLRHIVSSIPILSQEYPTQQFLGSIEPTYTLDFYIRDDSDELDGLSKEGQYLQFMRHVLQKNARKNRQILDSWCVATDTFITRLLGTYHQNDVSNREVSIEGFAGNPGFSLIDITKRTSIMRSNSGTIPGSPGLSILSLEVQETNPFPSNNLTPKAIDRLDLDEARSRVLNAVYSLDFIKDINGDDVLMLLALASGANILDPDAPSFGKITLEVETLEYNDGSKYVVQLPRESSGLVSRALEILEKDKVDTYLAGRSFDAINGAVIPLDLLYEYTNERPNISTSIESTDLRVETAEGTTGIVPVTGITIDISQYLLEESGSNTLLEGEYRKLVEYFTLVKSTLNTAERLMVEHSSKSYQISYVPLENTPIEQENPIYDGLTDEEISAELFNLPFDSKMWRSWQEYLLLTAYVTGGPSAPDELTTTEGWALWKEPLDAYTKTELKKKMFFSSADLFTAGSSYLQLGNFDAIKNNLQDNYLPSLTQYGGVFLGVNRNLVSLYLTTLPISNQLAILSDTYSFNNLFGSLFGRDEKTSKPRAFETLRESLLTNVVGSGYFVPVLNSSMPRFRSRHDLTIADQLDQISGNNEENVSFTDIALEAMSHAVSVPLSGIPFELWQDVRGFETNEERIRVAINADIVPGPLDMVSNISKFLAGLHSREHKFIWYADRSVEKEKVNYFKSVLASIADDIMLDPQLLKILGLVELADLRRRGRIVGTEAYPDMELPHHPYFGTALATPPDFYMWNIYKDGQILSEELYNKVADNVEQVIFNSYNSLKRIEQGFELDPKQSLDKNIVFEPSVDSSEELIIPFQYQAEGTDTGDYGQMNVPFYEDSFYKVNKDLFYSDLSSKEEKQKAAAKTLLEKEDSNAGATGSGKLTDEVFLEKKVVNVRVSNVEGYATTTAVGGLQYPRRMDTSDYKKLSNMVRDAESNISTMFGTRLNHINENITSESTPIADRLKGTPAERPDEYTHAFDVASLKKLAMDSSKDIVSERMTLRRAYPTFKLFFVEEDELETRTLNFDDFYSYNAVYRFTIEMSKHSPADHAVITLQNVGGTLDGTRRNAITDLDFFSGVNEEDLPEGASTLSNDVLNRDTSLDQPFTAVALRPGMNVQLRCGYSNDPDSLHVMLSGRVVDIQWNKNGDLTEIFVQSFGTELIQTIKGTHRDGSGEIFYTTHQLLGTLMMEPELVHFGRWEIGRLYQIGESSDYRLDFRDYTKDKLLPNLPFLGALFRSALNHPILSIAVTLLSGGLAPGLAIGTAAFLDANYLRLKSSVDKFNYWILEPLKKYYTTQKVSLFVSPQDDNLYPPHPKDYMLIDQGFVANILDRLALGFADIVGGTAGEIMATSYRWLNSNRLLIQKKVLPEQCQYQLVSTSIWKVFYEMSLRHPGWIYGPRPYGNEFRYTMFFGVPSQRYWARGVSNSFVQRMNDLHEYLRLANTYSVDKLILEYKRLYGNRLFDADVDNYLVQLAVADDIDLFSFPDENTQLDIFPADEVSPLFRGRLLQALTGPALKEYLTGLNFRFVPFRRYHLVTSERNLVWNGLLSAENAVVNAVDVTYFNIGSSATEAGLAPVGSTIIKAHSFIPEHQLRVAPIRWPNCKGYTMALRYGMGELVHRMKNMYRGEIIVTGNPRIRPWDVCILVDSYNDMVGPVEVDTVIHNFSHETGFITEIKPAAIVIGNEISTWPVLEAMQVFSLAIIDMENNYLNINNADSGVTDPTVAKPGFSASFWANYITFWNNEDLNERLREKHKDLFKDGELFLRGKNKPFSLDEAVFDNAPPEAKVIDDTIAFTETVQRASISTGISTTTSRLLFGPVGGPGVASGLSDFFGARDTTATDKIAAGFDVVANTVESIDDSVENFISSVIVYPNLKFLVGAPLLFLRCLRQDSVIVVPLMKNGKPIVAGLSTHDPTMIWSSIRGELRQLVDDVIDGTRDLGSEYAIFGTYIWNGIDIYFPFNKSDNGFLANTDLTGNLIR